MLTATKDLMLPATVTGSWPRPRWYDGGLWGRPLDTALLDVRFREQFLDAHATVIADQERAGLDILTNGDYHLDEDFAGPFVASLSAAALDRASSTRSCSTQRSRDALLAFAPGTLMNEIETTWRWPRVVGKVEHDPKNPLEYAKLWRIAQARARQAGQVRDVLVAGALDLPRQPHARIRPRRQEAADLGHGNGDERRAPPAGRGGRQGDPDRGAHDPLHRVLPTGGDRAARLHGRRLQPRGGRSRRRRAVDPHLLGQPQHAEGLHRRVVRELDRDLSRAPEGRRVDGRDDREQLRRDRPLQAVRRQPQEEGRGRRRQPPHACRPTCRRSSRGGSGARSR